MLIDFTHYRINIVIIVAKLGGTVQKVQHFLFAFEILIQASISLAIVIFLSSKTTFLIAANESATFGAPLSPVPPVRYGAVPPLLISSPFSMQPWKRADRIQKTKRFIFKGEQKLIN
jgi:hypothetical protein